MASALRRATRFAWRDTDRACLSVACIVFAAAAVPSVVSGPPAPIAHDEFSYLLAADTYAHGRLTNPTHPLWRHFETFHVLQRPTYASKYLPGQGLFLALGQVVSGFPIVGSWFALAAAAAAVCWALRAWLPSGWSFLGALLLVMRPDILLFWGDTYWGGNVPLLGGALVLGGAQRLCRGTRAIDGLALASGLVLLAWSRPYEGVVLALAPLGFVMVCRYRGRNQAQRAFWLGVVLPAASLLVGGMAFLGHANARVTGSPWRLPYAEYEAQYSNVPVFRWGEPSPRLEYRHDVFRRYYEGYAELTFYLIAEAPERWKFIRVLIHHRVFKAFLGFALAIPALIALRRPREAGLAAAMCASVLVANAASAWIWQHYFAPALAALALLVTLGLRRLMMLRIRRQRVGPVCVALVLVVAALEARPNWKAHREMASARHGGEGWPFSRERVLADLRGRPGRHLVIVRYAPDHNVHREWVYNAADIDASPVVWAREMDAASNRELLDYFRDRAAWLLLPDRTPLALVPYAGAQDPIEATRTSATGH